VQRKLTGLQHESSKVKRIAMQHNPARVADNLQHAANDDGKCVARRAVLVSLNCVCEDQDTEHRNQAYVRGYRGAVAQDAPFERADIEGAVGVGPEWNQAAAEPVGGHFGSECGGSGSERGWGDGSEVVEGGGVVKG
jgi:hypothetical protein